MSTTEIKDCKKCGKPIVCGIVSVVEGLACECSFAAPTGSVYWEEREQRETKREALVETAILAVKKLSDHLDTYDDKRWWYRANESMSSLWKIR